MGVSRRTFGGWPRWAAPVRIAILLLVIRVLTVDDHAVVRSGIVALLASEDGVQPVAAVGSCRAAQDAFDELHPDVVIADFRLPDGDGLMLCRRFERDGWPARVLVFSGFAGDRLALAATVAGAAGVLGKGTSGELLLAAVRAVASGGMPVRDLGPELLRSVAERLDPDDLPILSMRLDGTSTGEIAGVLRLDRETVEDRVDRIVEALKPRVEPPPLGAVGSERSVGRWV
jgi:DNA-binding NarL/FixJ family response regulator